jgi:drug/metabolite transporter (DMT)-like permease
MPTAAPPSDTRRGAIVAALVAAALFGIGTPAVKTLLGGVDEALVAGLLYLGMGVALAIVFVARGAPSPRLTRGELGWLAVSIALGGMLAPWLLFWGLARTPATVTALLTNAEVVFTTVLACLLFREPYRWRLATGLGLITAGTLLLGGAAAAPADLLPSLAILAGCLAWAIDNNATRRIAHADASFVGLAKGLVAGTCNTLLALGAGAAPPSAHVVLGAALIGAASYGLSFGLYVRALRHLGAARTSAYFATSPFAGAAVAIVMLGEPLSGRLLLAAALMAAGVWLHVTERHPPTPHLP